MSDEDKLRPASEEAVLPSKSCKVVESVGAEIWLASETPQQDVTASNFRRVPVAVTRILP